MSDQAANTEILRLHCLQALGIAVYHPRFVLPGAKPSVLSAWPEAPAAPHVVSKGAAANAEARAPQRGDGMQRVAEPAPKPVEPAGRTETASRVAASIAATNAANVKAPVQRTDERAQTAAPRAEAGMQPRQEAGLQEPVQNFQLLFLQVDDDLAIVNQIPALARPQLQDRQVALLTNLLRWLGKPLPAQAPRMFRWPLPGLEHMVASMSAQTSLLHFLEQASSERGFRFLLALGPQAVAPAASGWQTFATHSIDEMLALPALKREVWQTLQPLHARLHAKN
jgi:hypothetical protein